jgi:hypothetical protein
MLRAKDAILQLSCQFFDHVAFVRGSISSAKLYNDIDKFLIFVVGLFDAIGAEYPLQMWVIYVIYEIKFT